MYDISLSHDYYYHIVECVRKAVGNLGFTCGFGHLGDCNLHLSVTVENSENVEKVHHILQESLFTRLKQ